MALITQSQIDSHLKQIKTLEDSIASMEKSLADLLRSVEENDHKLKELNIKLTDLKTEIGQIEQSIRLNEKREKNTVSEIEDIEKELKRLEQLIEDAKEAGDKQEVEKIEIKISSLRDAIEEKNTELADFKRDREDLKNVRESKVDEQADMESFIHNEEDNFNMMKKDLEAQQLSLAKEKASLAEAQSSELVLRYNREMDMRRSHARNTLRNKERIGTMLSGSNQDVKEKLDELNSDSNILIEDIKDELNIDDPQMGVIKSITSDLHQQGLLIRANEAFAASRNAIFEVEDIINRIKTACSHGHTSVTMDMEDVSGTKMIVLNQAGYKLTHVDTDKGTQKIIIDWGFVDESQS